MEKGGKKAISKESIKRAAFVVNEAEKSLSLLKKTIGKQLEKALPLLLSRRGVIVTTGVGKSGFIAQKLAATLTSLGEPAIFLSPTDALHGDSGLLTACGAVIAISYSGESIELLKLVRHMKKDFIIPIIGMTGKEKSTLAKSSDALITTAIDKEGSPHNIAPMASTTASLVAGDVLAAALVDPKKFTDKHFARFHPGGSLGLSLTPVSEIMNAKMSLISEKSLFRDAVKKIAEHNHGIVGVLDAKKKIVGVITDGDVRRTVLKYKNLDNILVKDVMTKNPKIVEKKVSLKDALLMMENFKITTLFVCDTQSKPVGLVHIHTILSYKA